MKHIIFTLLILLSTIGSIKAQELTEVKIESRTRGGHKSITIMSDSIWFKLNDTVSMIATPVLKWEDLVKLTSGINLKQISNYTSTSEDRARDAAWHSKLFISTSINTYTSMDFDDVYAPEKLMPIVKFLLELDINSNAKEARIY